MKITKTSRLSITSARVQAHRLLSLVLDKRLTLDEAVGRAPLAGAAPDQRFVMLLVLTTLQHLGQIDAVIAMFLEKPLSARRVAVIHALRMGAAQLLLLDTPAHAAVNESVALVKNGKDTALAGVVNAVLQKIAREKPEFPPPLHNLPSWLRTRWEAAYGTGAVAVMAAVASTRAPLDINIRGHYGATGEVFYRRMDAHIIRLAPDHPPVESLPGYDDSAFFVQDLAASYPVRLLGDVRQLQVLDVCAAPGGKAMQLIQAGAFVTAIDCSSARMKLLKANLKRMRMEANTIVADAFVWQPSRAYDAILLDAPCSATGTWRRHPEMVVNVTPEAIAEMVTLQRSLLTRAWAWLKPGGKMVYCVCSLEADEGEAQAVWFQRATADAQGVQISAGSEIPAECITYDGYLRTLPSHKSELGGMDGFFAVCFEKR